jgi:CubicO group peptidase (beta-lactamase class C family)
MSLKNYFCRQFCRLSLIITISFVFALPIIAQTGIAVPSMSQCDTQMQTFMTNYQIPGATFALTRNGKLIYMRGFGNANKAGTEATQPYHLFRIASLSKQITSIAITKLIENGQLSLSDKPFGPGGILNSDAYFANANVADARIYNITIQHLLEHSAGWNRDLPMSPSPLPPYPWGYWHSDPIDFPLHVTQTLGEANPVTRRAMIKFSIQRNLDFTPGTAYNYSNVGYLVLGEVIEKKTGMTYENYVKQNIFAPLGIYDVRLGKNLLADKQEREGEYVTSPTYTTLSAYGTGQYVPWEYGGWSLEAMDAHGGWIATSRDLVRLITAVDGFSTRPDILSAATIQTMVTPSANNQYYAKGWAVNPSNNWWHTGALDGTASEMVRTNGQLTWAIILNKRSDDGSFWNALDDLGWNCVGSVSSFPTHDFFDVPSQNASNITFSNVGQNSMTVNWINGNGDGRVLIMRAGGAPNKFPLDGTDYTGGNPFSPEQDLGGGNFVVYSSAGSSAAIGNLTGNTNYQFRLYEYKKNANTGNNALYQLGNAASGSQNTLGPTAASVTIGGRVMSGKAGGISRARVYLTDANGETRTALTNNFGYYHFADVPAGETYILGVFHKRYTFEPQVLTVMEDINDFNFTAQF